MSLLRSMAGGLRSLFRKERVSQELDEELNGFLEMAAEEKMKEGMSRADALRAVRLEQGSLEVAKGNGSVLPDGNPFWKRAGRICDMDSVFCAKVRASRSRLC